MDDLSSPATGDLLEHLMFFGTLVTGRLAPRRPPTQMGERGRATRSGHQHLQPIPAGDKTGAPGGRLVVAGLDPEQTAGLAGAHRPEPVGFHTFRFFYNTLIPNGVNVILRMLKPVHRLIPLFPEVIDQAPRLPARTFQ